MTSFVPRLDHTVIALTPALGGAAQRCPNVAVPPCDAGQQHELGDRLILWMRGALSSGTARRRERRLVADAQNGSRDAFASLFRLHWTSAHKAAYLIVRDAAAAEDIAQEAFLAAIRNLERFDRRRPFAPWLHRIVTNRAIDWARARKLRSETQLDPVGSGVEPGRSGIGAVGAPAPVELGSGADVSDELMAALGSLSIEHRAVVVLRYLLEYTPSEIAAALEIPRGTVNSRLRRALDQLSSTYAEDGR